MVNGEHLIVKLCLKFKKKLLKICCAGLAKMTTSFLLTKIAGYSQRLSLLVPVRVRFSIYLERLIYFQQILTLSTKKCRSVISLYTTLAQITNLFSAISSMGHISMTLRWTSLILILEVITLSSLLIHSVQD